MAQPAKASVKRKAERPAAAPDTTKRTVTMTEDTLKSAAQEYGAKATEMLKDITAKAKTAFEKTGEATKEVAEFHKANLEAAVETGKLAAKSLQDVAQHGADISRQRFEAATAHAKTLAAIKSPTDFMSAQSEFLRGQFDAMVADFSKSTEFYLKLAGEIAQPMQNRYAAAAEQVKARFAA